MVNSHSYDNMEHLDREKYDKISRGQFYFIL